MTSRGRADDYRIAIPSYQRPAMVTERTLSALAAGGVDPDRVTVFLHRHDPHLDTYRDVLPPTGVHHVVTDHHGINAQRAGIVTAYPAGTPLVQCDDDLRRLVVAVDAKRTITMTDVHGFLRGMFMDTAARDLWVWGLSPTTNAFYMTPGRITEGLRFLLYALVGTFTRPGHPVHLATVPTKDDYELSLRSWWYDGASVRHDGAAADADIYKAPGGCQLTRRPEDAHVAVAALESDWPGLVRRNTRRKSDFPEIVLAARRRHLGHSITTPPPGVRPSVIH